MINPKRIMKSHSLMSKPASISNTKKTAVIARVLKTEVLSAK
jgi:hypothetical protein